MAKAGVQTEIAERVLGHAQDELIQIYDQHDYQTEMADALKRLAGLIEQIVADGMSTEREGVMRAKNPSMMSCRESRKART